MTQKQITIVHRVYVSVPEYGAHLSSDDLIKLVKDSGSHYFDADTMRAFKSRLHDIYPGVDGWYFVTSEKHEAVTSYRVINEPRLYSVRRLRVEVHQDEASGEMVGDLKIETVGTFQEHTTLNKARRHAKRVAATGAEKCEYCAGVTMHENWCKHAKGSDHATT